MSKEHKICSQNDKLYLEIDELIEEFNDKYMQKKESQEVIFEL